MRTSPHHAQRWLVALCVLFALLAQPTPGHSDQAVLAPAPGKAAALASARQLAETAIIAVAAQTALAAEADEWTEQQALATAGRRAALAEARQTAEQSGPVRLRPSFRGALSSPTPQPPVTTGQARVPILMYHHIADAPAGADAVRRDLSVSPAMFARQIEYLRSNGYHTISLADLVERLRDNRALPSKPIVLTFDDGYDDNYTTAFPLLLKAGFSGAFFIITDFVGQRGYARWDQIAEMARGGMGIEAHGRTHPDLSVASAADVTWQVAGSRAAIETRLGTTVRFYCYPSGRYTAQTISILRANGYTAAVTTAYGATHTSVGLFELARVRVRAADTLDQFVAKVETAP